MKCCLGAELQKASYVFLQDYLWIWIWIISRQGPRTEASHRSQVRSQVSRKFSTYRHHTILTVIIT